MKVYVAYNEYGDLVASSESYFCLLFAIEESGYFLSEVDIGMVTP